MRKISLICALACCGSWLAACGSSDSGSNNGTDGGLSGSTSTGGTGGTTGGTGGTTGGTGGTEGGTGGTTGGTGGTTGGTGGTTGGTGGTTGGTGGTTGGTGGTGGVVPPPPAYCDTHDKAALPYDVLAHFSAINEIGLAGIDHDFTNVANPDCDGALTLTANDAVDGGSDASAPVDASTGTPDASTGTDAGGPTDGGTVVDAGGDAGAPRAACYEFDYNPMCADGACWGGVIFQSNNIAADDTQGNADGRTGQGFCIATGAAHVTFMARASRATSIKFGSIREGVTQTEFWTPITTDWAQYTIAIPAGEPYNTSAAMGGVWNLFSIVASNENGGTVPVGGVSRVLVQIKDVHWTN